MATLLEIETQVYQNLLLGKQLPIPKTNHPQAECGRNIEQIIERYLDADKKRQLEQLYSVQLEDNKDKIETKIDHIKSEQNEKDREILKSEAKIELYA